MPTKPLYMADCLPKLISTAKIDLTGKNPKHLANTLPKMIETAMLEQNLGDEEKAFCLYMRWLETMKWLQKNDKFCKDKDWYKSFSSGTQAREVLDIVEKMAEKLEKRYSEKKAILQAKQIVNSIEKMEIESEISNDAVEPDKGADLALKLPETPTDDPLAAESEDFLTCQQLFQRMQKEVEQFDRILLIDIRSEGDFETSRIKHKKCINIPAEHIKLGILANAFCKIVRKDKNARHLFHERSKEFVDLLVLFDWHTTHATLTAGNRLSVIKTILLKWDPGVSYGKIVILEGGYAEWLNRYPAFTTNPQVVPPDLQENAMNEILEEVEYPDYLYPDVEEKPKSSHSQLRPEPQRNLKPVVAEKKSSVVEKPVTENKTIEQTKSLYDTNNSFNRNSSLLDHSKSLGDTNKLRTEKDNSKRIFDRTNPLVSNKMNDETALESSQEEAIFDHSTKVRKSIFDPVDEDIVMKPVVDRSSKPSTMKVHDADSEKVLSLMRSLNEVVRDQAIAENASLSLQSEVFSREEEGNFDPDEKKEAAARIRIFDKRCSEMAKKNLEIRMQISQFERENIKVNPAYQDEKSNLELSIGMNEQKIKGADLKRTKLSKKLEEKRERQLKELQTPKKNGIDTYKEPLKQDGQPANSGLKRSYSSPNLAQLDDRKESVNRWGIDNEVPQVDRTSKPQQQQQHRNHIGTSNANTRQSVLSSGGREQRMNPVFGNVHPGITGLKNLGNSCYMNSIIQCLSNTAYLAKYFIEGLYIDDLNTNNDNRAQSQVVEEVAQVIRFLWSGHYRSITPRDLKVVIGQYKLQFDSYEQQDSHEFLTFLLEWMHNDLRKKAKIGVDKPLSNAEKEWNISLSGETSIVSNLFVGQLRQTVICITCGYNSITYQTFNSLTMSLPESARCTLDDCIKKYLSMQKVSEFRCDKCKVPRDVTKKFDFVKLAPIVVVHLNRFGDSGGWIEKRNTAVDFPLTSFDLKRYLVVDSDTTTPNTHQHTYNLYAVSNHYGTMEGGHYTAYCKSAAQNKWYKYDDHTVTEVSQGDVKSQTASAYLLFYTSFPNSGYAM